MKDFHTRGFWPAGVIFYAFFTLAVVAMVGAMCPAATMVLFDNFSVEDQYSLELGEIFNCDGFKTWYTRHYAAVSFVPDWTTFLDHIDLPISFLEGSNEMDVVLFADNGTGLPGEILETIHLSGRMPIKDGMYHAPLTATSVLRPQMEGGKTYWIAVSPGAAPGLFWVHAKIFWHNCTSGATQPSAWNHMVDGIWRLEWKPQNFACTMRVVGRYSGCARPKSDLNGDCKVNLADLAILAEDWLKCGRENPADC